MLDEEKTKLWHMDRIIFGNNSVFLFRYPKQKHLLEELDNDKASLTQIIEGEKDDQDDEEEETKEKDAPHFLSAETYDHDELESDLVGIDWETAINEMLKYTQTQKQEKESEELKAQEIELLRQFEEQQERQKIQLAE